MWRGKVSMVQSIRFSLLLASLAAVLSAQIGPTGGGGQGSGQRGPAGINGSNIFSGSGAPSIQGVNGDFYLATDTGCLYGPKLSGAWPVSCLSLVGPAGGPGQPGPQGPAGDIGPQGPAGTAGSAGPQGPQGPQGPTGIPGTNGNTLLNGTSGPQSGEGNDGDFFLSTDTSCLYGPKANGVWPGSCVSLVGAPGPQGPAGDTGPQGPAGDTGPQGPAGVGTCSQGTGISGVVTLTDTGSCTVMTATADR